MTFNASSSNARAGELAQLVGLRHKHFIITLQAGARLETHRGILQHDDLIGKPWGTQVFSHLGSPFFLLQPSLGDLLNDLPRSTQILYPKDIGFILVTMGIGPGKRVIEAGTGSGSMTIALAHAIGAEGKVISYEIRPDMQNLAKKNLERVGFAERVDFKLRDIAEGLDETDADAFFLDLPNPYDYIPQVRAALKPGGFFCSLLPTVNQVEQLLIALRRERFALLEF
jgi:tRNA (adenine57-N1/adenine58-N1)-methyltransferase catalytic subunit